MALLSKIVWEKVISFIAHQVKNEVQGVFAKSITNNLFFILNRYYVVEKTISYYGNKMSVENSAKSNDIEKFGYFTHLKINSLFFKE
jgi:hypothetical protein